MYKGKKILGTMVMDLHAGRKLGRVRNIILDIHQRKISSLIMPGKSWLHPSIWMDFKFVWDFGADVLIVDPLAKVITTREINNFKEHIEKGIDRFWGMTVVSSTGELVGYVEDFFFSIPEGRIEGINLSRGILGDVLEGWSFIPAKRISTLSFDCIVVQEE